MVSIADVLPTRIVYRSVNAVPTLFGLSRSLGVGVFTGAVFLVPLLHPFLHSMVALLIAFPILLSVAWAIVIHYEKRDNRMFSAIRHALQSKAVYDPARYVLFEIMWRQK